LHSTHSSSRRPPAAAPHEESLRGGDTGGRETLPAQQQFTALFP
jgi:hypothetical protein